MGNSTSSQKCSQCGSTQFETRITATGLPTFDLSLLDHNSIQRKALEEGKYQLPPHCRLVCCLCGCPSVLADVPAPSQDADYHPDMIQRVKLHIFKSSLPPFLQQPGISAQEILDFILPFFKTGHVQPLLNSLEDRHQNRLNQLKDQIQTTSDGNCPIDNTHQLINQYLQLEMNKHYLLRGQLVANGKEYFIPYEDKFSNPKQTLHYDKSVLRGIRVVVGQCYPAVGFITNKTVVSLGHNFDERQELHMIHILPSEHSLLEAPKTSIGRVPELYQNWFAYEALKSAAHFEEGIALRDTLPSSGWSLSQNEAKVVTLTSNKISTSSADFLDTKILSIEELAWSTPGGIIIPPLNLPKKRGDNIAGKISTFEIDMGANFWTHGVKFHNSTVEYLNNLSPALLHQLQQHNETVDDATIRKLKLNTASNEDLYQKLLSDVMLSLKELGTKCATALPTRDDPTSSEKNKNNGLISNVGNHMFMGKSFVIDQQYDKIHKEMEQLLTQQEKQRQKDIKDHIALANECDMADLGVSARIMAAQKQSYSLYSPQSTCIEDLDEEAIQVLMSTSTNQAESSRSRSSLRTRTDLPIDPLTGQTVAPTTHLGALRNQSTDHIIAARYADTEAFAVPYHPKIIPDSHGNIVRLKRDEITTFLKQLVHSAKNHFFLNFFRRNNKAPNIYSNTSYKAVQFQVIRCTPENGFLGQNTQIWYAGTIDAKNKKIIHKITNLDSIDLQPIACSIPTGHRYTPGIDHCTSKSVYEETFTDFARPLMDSLQSNQITHNDVIKLFRHMHGVESRYIANQLTLYHHILPGLTGTFRRLRKGQVINVNGIYCVVTQISNNDQGFVTPLTKINITPGIWGSKKLLPKNAVFGAFAQEHKLKCAQVSSSTAVVTPEDQTHSLYPLFDGQDDEVVEYQQDKHEILSMVYSTPMSSQSREMFESFINTFDDNEPILKVLYHTLLDAKERNVIHLSSTDFSSSLTQYQNTKNRQVSQQLIESMRVYRFNPNNPLDSSLQVYIRYDPTTNSLVHTIETAVETKVDEHGLLFNPSHESTQNTTLTTTLSVQSESTPLLIQPPIHQNVSSLSIPRHHNQKRGDHVECAICCSQYQDGDFIRILKCDHRFHSACIVQFFLHSTKCPYCRTNIADIGPKHNNGSNSSVSFARQ